MKRAREVVRFGIGALVALCCMCAPSGPTFAQDPSEAPKAQDPPPANNDAEKADAAKKETEAAKKDVEVAKKDAEVVKAKEDAEAAKKDAQDAKMAAQAKRLIRYGVSAGAAASIQIPLPGTNTLAAPVAAAMPYLVFVPAFWGTNSARNAYCAARWSGPEENAVKASQAESNAGVTGQTYRDEKLKLEKLQSQYKKLSTDLKKANDSVLDREKDIGEQCPKAADTKKDTLESVCPKLKNDIDALDRVRTGRDLLLADSKKLLAEVEDQEALVKDRNCKGHMFGAYIGYPASFGATTAVVRGTAENVAQRDVSPVVSFGGAFVPNAIVALLVGPTVGTVKRDNGTSAVVWSFSIGIGANLDIVNAIP